MSLTIETTRIIRYTKFKKLIVKMVLAFCDCKYVGSILCFIAMEMTYRKNVQKIKNTFMTRYAWKCIFYCIHFAKEINMKILSTIWNAIQCTLFPFIEEEFGELSDKEKQFVRVCELCTIEKHIQLFTHGRFGRPKKERLSLALAFVAKAVYNYSNTKILIDYLKNNATLRRLCGWESKKEIPSESTFSRAFTEFAHGELPQIIHENMVKKHCSEKLAGHVSRDSTPISSREKPKKKPKKVKKAKGKRGRPKKGEVRQPKSKTKLQIQLNRTYEENITDIPTSCDTGNKKDSKGYKKSWIGYKLHVDCIDGDIPVSTLLSSASTHDSQVAIPLAQMTAKRVTNLYDLMDSAYDSKEIYEVSKRLNHIPVIGSNKRKGDKKEFDPAKKVRYNQRSSAERIMSNLKDNYGGNNVRVKGNKKVMAHLMFGIIAMTADQLFRMII